MADSENIQQNDSARKPSAKAFGFPDAEILLRLLTDARPYGLEHEVAQDFIEEYRRGSPAAAAAFHARCEWDL